MTVAVDTMVFIWGQKRKGAKRGNPRQADLLEMQCRSLILLDLLEEKKERVIIPTVMVSELLLGVEPQFHGDYLAELQRRFLCPPYDLRAAALAAELWQHHRGLPKEEQLQRSVLRADVMIIATAKVAGATDFYSHDKQCRSLAAKAGMKGQNLPIRHPDMFRDAEIRREFGL